MIHAGHLLAVLALPAVVLLTAGCGGDQNKSFREHQLRPLEQRIDDQRAQLAALLQAARPGSSADARALRSAASPLSASAGAAAALHAPSSAVKPLRAYASAVAGVARELTRFATALARGESAGLRAEVLRTRDAIGALQSAQITLDQAVAG